MFIPDWDTNILYMYQDLFFILGRGSRLQALGFEIRTGLNVGSSDDDPEKNILGLSPSSYVLQKKISNRPLRMIITQLLHYY